MQAINHWIFSSARQFAISTHNACFYISDVLSALGDEESRLDVLAAAHEAGVDTTAICKGIYTYAVQLNRITDAVSVCYCLLFQFQKHLHCFAPASFQSPLWTGFPNTSFLIYLMETGTINFCRIIADCRL